MNLVVQHLPTRRSAAKAAADKITLALERARRGGQQSRLDPAADRSAAAERGALDANGTAATPPASDRAVAAHSGPAHGRDRVGAALDRAAQAKGDGADGPILRRALAPVRQPAIGSAARRGPIKYSRTRVVEVPLAFMASRRLVVAGAPPGLVNAVKLIRTQVVQRMRENDWRTIGVIGTTLGEGSTFMAANLAISIAMELDQTALLVDANLRRPSVHALFGLGKTPGISHFLLRDAPLQSLLVNPGLERLLVLPAGRPQPNSAELVGSAQMADLVRDLKSRYRDRIVVFDMPPLLRAADALALAPLLDCLLLVVAQGRTARDEFARAQKLLGHANILGAVLNQVPTRSPETITAGRVGFFKRVFGRRTQRG